MNKNGEDGTKNLGDEPGIPELQSLYFDDYNYTTGTYVGVTDEGMEVYMKDLETFWTDVSEISTSYQRYTPLSLSQLDILDTFGCGCG